MQTGTLSSYSWAMIFRGIVAILFGVLALFWPGLTLEVLVIIFALFALVDGIIAIIAAISSMAHHKQWWAFLLEGIFGILIGILVLLWPTVTLIIFLYLIAAWAVITGIMEFVAAFSIEFDAGAKALIAICGVLSVVLGLLMFFYPITGLIIITWLVGIYAILFGIMIIIFGMQVKKIA